VLFNRLARSKYVAQDCSFFFPTGACTSVNIARKARRPMLFSHSVTQKLCIQLPRWKSRFEDGDNDERSLVGIGFTEQVSLKWQRYFNRYRFGCRGHG
jgi:hypothetical protein